jgi:hypothetical protein
MTQSGANAEIAWQKASNMPTTTGNAMADSARFLAMFAVDDAAFKAVE